MADNHLTKHKRNKLCSCLDIIKRAFVRQQSGGLPFTQHTDTQSQGKFAISGISDATTGTTFYNGDMTTHAIINKQKGHIIKQNSQKQASQLQQRSVQEASVQGNSNQDNEYIFRFIQRYDYLAKKFAPKRDYQTNKNNRTIQNVVVKTQLDDVEIKYCEGINGNTFLLKYFKFECGLCLKLCSHTLITDCCKAAVCLKCVHDLCKTFEINGPLQNCMFCNKNVVKLFLLRDPYSAEQKDLAKKTLAIMKKAELSYVKDESIRISEIQNKSLSAVKPHKLEFYETDLNTATSLKRKFDFLTQDQTAGYCPFDEFIMHSSSTDSPESIDTKESALQYTTKDFTSLNSQHALNFKTNNNDKYLLDVNITHTSSVNNISQESKALQCPPARHLGARKRIQHKKSSSSNSSKRHYDSTLALGTVSNEEENMELPLSKRLRQRKPNNENVNTANSGSLNKLSKRIRKS